MEKDFLNGKPNDMSDNAEKYLNRFDIWDHPRITNRNETESYDVTELMQSYAEQHLEDVLGEITEEKIRVMAKDFYHVGDDKDLPLECGRLQGAKWLLNLLKQRKG